MSVSTSQQESKKEKKATWHHTHDVSSTFHIHTSPLPPIPSQSRRRWAGGCAREAAPGCRRKRHLRAARRAAPPSTATDHQSVSTAALDRVPARGRTRSRHARPRSWRALGPWRGRTEHRTASGTPTCSLPHPRSLPPRSAHHVVPRTWTAWSTPRLELTRASPTPSRKAHSRIL